MSAREFPADDALRGRVFTRGAFAPNTFIPSVRPDKLVELLTLFGNKDHIERSDVANAFGRTRAPGAIQDAVNLDLIDGGAERIRLGSQGRILRDSGRQITARDIAQFALAKPNVRALLDGATVGTLSETQQREVIASFGSAKWADGTWKWRLGILRSWVVATGLAKSTRSGLVAT